LHDLDGQHRNSRDSKSVIAARRLKVFELVEKVGLFKPNRPEKGFLRCRVGPYFNSPGGSTNQQAGKGEPLPAFEREFLGLAG
jgi:hypothetical protein